MKLRKDAAGRLSPAYGMGCLMLGIGVIGLTCGWPVGVMLGTALPVQIGVAGLVLGTLVLAVTMGLALADSRRPDSSRPLETIPGAFIANVYARTTDDEVVTDPAEYHQGEVRFYAMMSLPGQEPLEYRTDHACFTTLGEGQRGTATVRGQTLLSFIPDRAHLNRNTPDVPPDPFATGQL
ncbi:MAG: hypothetical protein MH204_06060 [Fimbriimonadaceae bacterium]|nr:hypothetical protein [Fimbriimonadaceae bacterium]